VVSRFQLVQLDKDYAAARPDAPWPDWYAERIVEDLGARADSP
jgi:hypothetical protein